MGPYVKGVRTIFRFQVFLSKEVVSQMILGQKALHIALNLGHHHESKEIRTLQVFCVIFTLTSSSKQEQSMVEKEQTRR